MNWKAVSLLICAFAALAVFLDFHKRSADRDAVEFLRAQPIALRPLHSPPIGSEIIALAEKDAHSFCYPADKSADGCQFDAVLIENEWTVFVRPYTGSPDAGYRCCAVDSAHLFIYSRSGSFLREMRGP